MEFNSGLLILIGGIVITVIFLYFLLIRKPGRPQHIQTSIVRRVRQAINDNECCICLNEEKKFQASITCGHSFCGKCLLGLHRHSNQKINCPLCRQQINIIFKAWHDEQPKEEGLKTQLQIREYNYKFTDDRSFWRKLSEFPYVLRATKDKLLTIGFIRYFFSGARLLKIVVINLLYLIWPVDMLPQRQLGSAGYLDDFWVFVIVFLYSIANSVVNYVRRRQ